MPKGVLQIVSLTISTFRICRRIVGVCARPFSWGHIVGGKAPVQNSSYLIMMRGNTTLHIAARKLCVQEKVVNGSPTVKTNSNPLETQTTPWDEAV
uniref:Uncharacterized protein n=1 Tax=Tanacetum cinerariifolium TaxID=118510 RepID=A0A6L2NZT3_TANCI|nr:hypothetical protein [Tanacetum cinerariifolium]